MAPSPAESKKRSSTLGDEAIQRSSSSGTNKRLKTDSSTVRSSNNVRVVARVRPLSTKEINESAQEAIGVVPSLDRSTNISVNMNLSGRTTTSSANSPKLFEYDGAFGPNTTQQELYEQTVGDMVRTNIYQGFNVTVMAYGQTGSGKVSL